MKIRILKEDAINKLYEQLDITATHLLSHDKAWFDKYFEDNKSYIDTGIEVGDFELIPNDYLNNIIKTHQSLCSLNSSQLVDRRLWIGLIFDKYFDFMIDETQQTTPEKFKNAIQNQLFFAKHGQRRSLMLNRLSRLYMVGKLTYFKQLADPYEMTKLYVNPGVFSNALVVFELHLDDDQIRYTFFKAIKSLSDKGFILKREQYVRVSKYLNFLVNINSLTLYSEKELLQMIVGDLIEHNLLIPDVVIQKKDSH